MTNFFKERGIDMPALYEQENEENPVAHAHFLKESESGKVWHWYVTEAGERDGDLLLFGLVTVRTKNSDISHLCSLQALVQDWTKISNTSEYTTYMRTLTCGGVEHALFSL